MYIFYETTNVLDLPSTDLIEHNFKMIGLLGDMPLLTQHRNPYLCVL